MISLGKLPDGREVHQMTLTGGGVTAKILTLGSILRDLRLDGIEHSLTLGSANLASYLSNFRFGGAIVGPVANRIGKASALLQGRRITLPANEGTTCLHGGPHGLDSQIWSIADHRLDLLVLSLDLADGSDGWPGNRRITARWTLPASGTLALELTATSDAPTLFAPAQHGYWRLGPGRDLTDHRLFCPAERYTAVDAAKIPTGDVPAVHDQFDFRSGKAVGPAAMGRIDHNLCLFDTPGALRPICRLEGPSARLSISSTEPGLQVYDAAHFATREVIDIDGHRLPAFAGLALEPQLWPDAANQSGWASPLLQPEETYRQETRWDIEKR